MSQINYVKLEGTIINNIIYNSYQQFSKFKIRVKNSNTHSSHKYFEIWVCVYGKNAKKTLLLWKYELVLVEGILQPSKYNIYINAKDIKSYILGKYEYQYKSIFNGRF